MGLQIAADLAISAITNFSFFVASAQPGDVRHSDILRAARDIEYAARRVVEACADAPEKRIDRVRDYRRSTK